MPARDPMIRRLGRALDRFFSAVTPDPLVLAVLLTLVTALLALALTSVTPGQVLEAWSGPRGLFGLLGFTMQMCLVLVTGHALAGSRLVKVGVDRLAVLPRTGAQAAALVAGAAVLSSLLNWGLGLIVGALLAREVGRSTAARGIRAHYPLLAAAGYSGMMTWHGGLSGSAPLKVTTQKDLIELLGPELGNQVAPIPLFETTFGGLNLWVTLGLLVWVPVVAYLLAPKGDEPVVLADLPAESKVAPTTNPPTPNLPERIFGHPGTMLLLALPLLAASIQYIEKNGIGSLDPNALNLFMLLLGLLLHGNLRAYARAVEGAVGGCAGIMLQFPLYAGIMGIMTGTGLARVLAEWSAGATAPNLYVAQTFLGAALINMFIPSGGGQWAVQGPIAVEAARILGIPLSHAVMAVAYGDQWSNMLQPFWALPLLGITGVKAKDIIGYSATIMLVSGVWILGVIWLWV